MLKLIFAADQMIKLVNLPEFTRPILSSIDLSASESLSCRALREHRFFSGKRCDEMYVVRHDNGICQIVSMLIKMPQTIQDLFGMPWLRQQAATVCGIKELVTGSKQIPLNAPASPIVSFPQFRLPVTINRQVLRLQHPSKFDIDLF